MKYNVGDKVRIKSIDWYNENQDANGDVLCFYDVHKFTNEMSKFCGKTVTISTNLTGDGEYLIKEDDETNWWTDDMIECKVEENTKSKFKVGDKVILAPYPCIVTDVHWRDSLHGFVYTVRGTDFGKTVKETDLVFDERPIPTTDEIIKNIKADWNNFKNRYNLPNEYHFVDKNGNEINISEIVLEKKKKEYPKTFRECQKYLGEDVPPMEEPVSKTHRRRQVHLLEVLLICRDAYWKMAGDEMGLGKPWEPDWEDKIYYVYYERHRQYGIGIKKAYSHCGIRGNRILVFPTEEMVNAFYEAFKNEIEICKELL